MKRRKSIILAVFLMCLPLGLRAQFQVSGNDAASVRYNQIKGRNFRMIYPKDCDSLALEYIKALEYFRPRVAPSIGMVSGQFQSRPLDVILYTRNAYSNGMVSWTPNRVELYSVPQWSSPSAMPWTTMLAVHEGRHAAQMQMGYRRFWRPFRYILGQLVPGAVNIYPGHLLLEGDAVVAETGLTKAGRGREANFLMRYFYSFDHGDFRSYPTWLLGSYYRPAPDHYALGYAMISGARTRYKAPYFMADYMDYIARRPYDPWPLRHALRRTSGVAGFKRNFRDVMDQHFQAWAADTLSRAPFDRTRKLSQPKGYMAQRSSIAVLDDSTLFYVEKDIYHNPSIIRLSLDSEGGKKARRVCGIASFTGHLEIDRTAGKLYWNEVERDVRWAQRNTSVIRELDIATGKQRVVLRPEKGANLVNVKVVGEGRLAAVEYLENGRENVALIDAGAGAVTSRIPVPSGMQLLFLCDVDGVLYATGIVAEGMGIWKESGGKWENVLEAIPAQIQSMDGMGGDLHFSCDRSGVMEYYRLDVHSGALARLTSNKYGAQDFRSTPGGAVLSSQMDAKGSSIVLTRAEDLHEKDVEWGQCHSYAVADEISRQEDTLRFSQRLALPRKLDMSSQTEFPQSERYRRAAHGIRIHSWAPLYVNQDILDDVTSVLNKNVANPGAMVWLQNSRSTLYGQVGYQAARAADGKWNHSAHMVLTYTGLYPVFEFGLHINERKAEEYNKLYFVFPGSKLGDSWIFTRRERKAPYVSASLRTYIPLQWNRGQWSFGFIPEASVRYNNDSRDGLHTFLFNAGMRTYAMLPTPSAAVYPRWGVGAELKWLDPYTYAYLYGYLPGIGWGQGLRLSALYQWSSRLSTSEIYLGGRANIMPDGFNILLASYLCEGLKLSAEYAIPFPMGDWHIGSAFMCKRGIVTPSFDYSCAVSHKQQQLFDKFVTGGNLYAAGISFELEFGAFLWMRTPVRLGVRYKRLEGDIPSTSGMNRNSINAIFNITLPN